jgi:hypothetical protein
MRTEESAAHAYTATWSKDGEIGYVALRVALGSGTCASASGLLWS